MDEAQIDDEEWFEKERLHRAASSGDMQMIESLLAEGVPAASFDALAYTPLHYAAVAGHIEAMKRILLVGADVNANLEKRIGDTALKEAATNCSLEMATILVDAGADPTIPGWMSLTALDYSCDRKDARGRAVHCLLVEAASRINPSWPRLGEFRRCLQSWTPQRRALLRYCQDMRRILRSRSFGVASVFLLVCVPASWKVLTIITVNVPPDVVWVKASVSAITYLVVTAAALGIAGLMLDSKKALAGFTLFFSLLGGFYLLMIGLFSMGFWP